jgi:hypothetical protein
MDGVFLSIVFAQYQSDFEIKNYGNMELWACFDMDIRKIRISPQWELEQLEPKKDLKLPSDFR